MTRTAHCCCGALRVEVSADPDAVVACHCGECQRRTGSVFGVGAYFKKEHVRAEGPSKIYVRWAGGTKAQTALLPNMRNDSVLGCRFEARPHRRCCRRFP